MTGAGVGDVAATTPAAVAVAKVVGDSGVALALVSAKSAPG